MTSASTDHRPPERAGLGCIAAIAAVLLGCSPTVRVGSDLQGSSSATGATDGDGPGTSLVISSGGLGSGGGSGGTTTSSVGGTGTSSSGAPSDSGSGTTASPVCEIEVGKGECLECAQQLCCDELTLCVVQEGCNCFLDCLAVSTPQECQGVCDPSSGAAAMTVCLAMSCPGVCG